MRICARFAPLIVLIAALQFGSTSVYAAEESRPGRWYVLAIQGDTDAQYLLGVAYYTGEYHVQQDLSKAEEWLEKAHQGGHKLAQAKLNEVRQASEPGGAGVNQKHQQLVDNYPQAVALAETLLQRTLLKSNSSAESCNNLGIYSGTELLRAPFYMDPDPADYSGGQIAKDTLRCFSSTFYGLSASAYSVIDVDTMKSAGVAWDRSNASNECKTPIKAMNADSAGKPLNSLGQVRLHSTGYQISQYFQDCVIAQVEVLVEILPYWSGNRDPNFTVPREPLSDAEIDKRLGVVRFGDWSYRKHEKAAVVFGGPAVAHMEVACINGSLHLQISASPRFKNLTPDFHIASATVRFSIDGGSAIQSFGRLVDKSAHATWQFDDDGLLALLGKLQSGSKLSAGAVREPKVGSRGIYMPIEFSLKGSKAAINEVRAACER